MRKQLVVALVLAAASFMSLPTPGAGAYETQYYVSFTSTVEGTFGGTNVHITASFSGSNLELNTKGSGIQIAYADPFPDLHYNSYSRNPVKTVLDPSNHEVPCSFSGLFSGDTTVQLLKPQLGSKVPFVHLLVNNNNPQETADGSSLERWSCPGGTARESLGPAGWQCAQVSRTTNPNMPFDFPVGFNETRTFTDTHASPYCGGGTFTHTTTITLSGHPLGDLSVVELRAVQSADIGVPLAAGKETLLWATLRNTFKQDKTVNIRVSLPEDDGSTTVLEQTVTLHPGNSDPPLLLPKNMTFRPPVGDIDASLEVNFDHKIDEDDFTNNELHTAYDTAVKTGTYKVGYFQVCNGTESNVESNLRCPMYDGVINVLNSAQDYVDTTFPLDDRKVNHTLPDGHATILTSDPNTTPTEDQTMLAMHKLHATAIRLGLDAAVGVVGFDSPDWVGYALVPRGWGYTPAEVAGGPARAVFVRSSARNGVIGHELAHARGAQHAGGTVMGFDAPAHKRLTTPTDFMRPEGPIAPAKHDDWVSTITWNMLLDSFEVASPHAAPDAAPTPTSGLVVSGYIDGSNTVHMDPVTSIPGTASDVIAGSDPGPFGIEIRDQSNTVLFRGGFDELVPRAEDEDPPVYPAGPTPPIERGSFAVRVPQFATAETIAILSDGQEIATSSAHPTPAVNLTATPARKVVTHKRTASVRFGFTSDTGSTFGCSIDGGPVAPCTSPATFKVKPGTHSVSVVATDDDDVTGWPTSYNFRVVRPHG